MQIKKVFRQERKFLISGEQYYRFSRQFAELFKEDSHNGKDGYMVRSLYFDTLGKKDFEEKLAGVEFPGRDTPPAVLIKNLILVILRHLLPLTVTNQFSR